MVPGSLMLGARHRALGAHDRRLSDLFNTPA